MEDLYLMSLQKKAASSETECLLGEVHALAEQLGSPEAVVSLGVVAASLRLDAVTSAETLKLFLGEYVRHVLIPRELPAIQRAYWHTLHNEGRELLAVDREMTREPYLEGFASASHRVGKGQLKRLRPLRDERVVQKYLSAVEAGKARAWHTLVYGVTLGIYSLPLRQGLMHYAEQTLSGFTNSACGARKLAQADCRKVLGEVLETLPHSIDSLLNSQNNGDFLVAN